MAFSPALHHYFDLDASRDLFPELGKDLATLTKKYSTLLFYCITNQLWSPLGNDSVTNI